MRLVHLNDAGELSLAGPFYSDIPPYAILSHRWREGEVTFNDFAQITANAKSGHAKLQFCADQARRDGWSHFWIDTCCINKESAAELSEAIISMFRWYEKAAICYVYLDDVSSHTDDLEAAFAKSEWFKRGWTLQELLAPASVQFFSREGDLLGDKESLEKPIHSVTGIDLSALRGRALASFTVHERMRWVATRKTTREEDQAYSLLGIFDVSMPALYGEGRERAMARLEKLVGRLSPSPETPPFLSQTDLPKQPTANGESAINPMPSASRFSSPALPPLLIAAASPSIEGLQQIIASTPNINITEGEPLRRNALHMAAITNQYQNIVPLLRAGADVHAVANGGVTPLFLACMTGSAEVVRLLLTEGGENPNSRNQNQHTPLHAAALNGHVHVTRLLLEHGADPFAAGSEGWLPLHAAVVKQHTSIIELLSLAMKDHQT